MSVFASLTNRLFFATAIVALVSIVPVIYLVNRAVSRQAYEQVERSTQDAAALVEAYRRFTFEAFGRDARLIADIPMLKAAVDTHDPATVKPLAEEYGKQLVEADLFAIVDNRNRVLVRLGGVGVSDRELTEKIVDRGALMQPRSTFWPMRDGLLLVKSVPIWVESGPDVLGTLILGASLDVARFKVLTNSEIAFGVDGRILAATLPAEVWPALSPLLERPGPSTQIRLGNEYYVAHHLSLTEEGATTGQAVGLVLRSQTQSLRFLRDLHAKLALTAVLAVLVAIVSSYAIARTVTRPLGSITSTMREMAASGDLSRRIPMPDSRWQDEDARLLATTFNSMTDSIERFQRDATQRERLSSLGRLSTVIAHEIRNPLMIMKTSLRSLRREDTRPDQVRAAAEDIDEEVTRLNRIVAQVLDFARPIKFDVASADLNALARDAVHAAEAAAGADGVRLALDPDLPAVRTDAERLRQALVNIIGNAIQAVADETGAGGSGVRIRTARLEPGRAAVITVSDSGAGIAAADLPRVFEPYFTTRRTGTGIGLAISRNIIEGLGGRISVASEQGRGTDVRIELPLDGPSA